MQGRLTAALRIGNIGIDCADHRSLVRFWNRALGYETKYSDDSGALLRHPEGLYPKLYLQVVPEPRVGKNRLHLDLYSPDEEAEAERLTALGATRRKRFDTDDGVWIVMTDPEGNEFCICRDYSDNIWS